jgi:hypothetical protein
MIVIEVYVEYFSQKAADVACNIDKEQQLPVLLNRSERFI